MNKNIMVLSLALCAAVIALSLQDSARAQPEALPLPEVGRYQISAYGDAIGSGYYVIDTATGQVYESREGPAGSVSRIGRPISRR